MTQNSKKEWLLHWQSRLQRVVPNMAHGENSITVCHPPLGTNFSFNQTMNTNKA